MTLLLFHLFIRINYCYYCNYHNIICIIFASNYYYYYLFRRLLLHLFLYIYIISIIAIITLLFALFYIKLLLLLYFSKLIILIISFRQNPSLLLQLCLISHYYLHYTCVWPLSQLSLLKSIICIISFSKHFLHYCNYGGSNNAKISICTQKWYMATHTGFNSRNAFVYTWGSYRSKNIAKSRWSVHLRFGRHPQETGV